MIFCGQLGLGHLLRWNIQHKWSVWVPLWWHCTIIGQLTLCRWRFWVECHKLVFIPRMIGSFGRNMCVCGWILCSWWTLPVQNYSDYWIFDIENRHGGGWWWGRRCFIDGKIWCKIERQRSWKGLVACQNPPYNTHLGDRGRKACVD